jgi:hypothetical protein
MSSELLTVSEAARWAKVSESFLNKARLTGDGPRYVRLGRAIRYRQEDLESWAQQSAAASTSEYDQAMRFPDDAVRAAVVSARDTGFARSYLDQAAWNAETRTVTARNRIARDKLRDPDLRAILAELGVKISDLTAGGL